MGCVESGYHTVIQQHSTQPSAVCKLVADWARLIVSAKYFIITELFPPENLSMAGYLPLLSFSCILGIVSGIFGLFLFEAACLH